MSPREIEILTPIVASFIKKQPLNVAHLTIAYNSVELKELKIAIYRAMNTIEKGCKIKGMVEDSFGSKRYALKYLSHLETQAILINRAIDYNVGRILYGIPVINEEELIISHIYLN